MKSTGIVRNVDELGRIVIPKEMRTKMNISSSDPIEIYVEEDKIILKKYSETCLFCGSCESLTAFKGKNVCSVCLEEIKA
ncbi:MAG: AbrB/MazE/SpoVT family DNA-binding domain-containing protein [Clostridia bacterium]|nr:AbrB/MazE/SpoVT family DNA-binding domain-containing protein [Clostridia bacterium]